MTQSVFVPIAVYIVTVLLSGAGGVLIMFQLKGKVQKTAEEYTDKKIEKLSSEIPKAWQDHVKSEISLHKNGCTAHKHILPVKSGVMWLVLQHPNGGADKVHELRLDQ